MQSGKTRFCMTSSYVTPWHCVRVALRWQGLHHSQGPAVCLPHNQLSRQLWAHMHRHRSWLLH